MLKAATNVNSLLGLEALKYGLICLGGVAGTLVHDRAHVFEPGCLGVISRSLHREHRLIGKLFLNYKKIMQVINSLAAVFIW